MASLKSAPASERARAVRAHIRKADAQADNLVAPDFPPGLEWFNCAPLSLDTALQNKIVVLDFWTYACINCQHVLEEVHRMEQRLADSPVVFVGVHSPKHPNEGDGAMIENAIHKHGLQHPVVNDSAKAMWRMLGVRSWPTVAVLGPTGALVYMVSGESSIIEVLGTVVAETMAFYQARLSDRPVPLRPLPPPAGAVLNFPGGLALDANRNRLFVADTGHHRVLVVQMDGEIELAVGSAGGQSGDGVGALSVTRFRRPQGLAFDSASDTLYVADTGNHRVVAFYVAQGVTEVVAGTGAQGRDTEGGRLGPDQPLNSPWDLEVVDDQLYISMAGCHQIWALDTGSCVARAVSGTGRESALNGPVAQANWAQPSGLSLAPGGHLFVADSESSTIRSMPVSAAAGSTTRTWAGGDAVDPTELHAFGSGDGVGQDAKLQHPLGVLFARMAWPWPDDLPPTVSDPYQRRPVLVVADTFNHCIRLLDIGTRRLTTWIGRGDAGNVLGMALSAQFNEPSALCLGADGRRVFVADTNNHAVKVLDLERRTVSLLSLYTRAPSPPAPAPARPSAGCDGDVCVDDSPAFMPISFGAGPLIL